MYDPLLLSYLGLMKYFILNQIFANEFIAII